MKRGILFLGLFVLCMSFTSAIQSFCTSDNCTLYNGETISYQNHTYKIAYIYPTSVKLSVDGRMSPYLYLNKPTTFNNLKLTITRISNSSVIFQIVYQITPPTPIYKPVSSCSGSYCTIYEGQDATAYYGGKPYLVRLNYISSIYVRVGVNGETTNLLGEGSSYKLSDGTIILIKDILYSAKENESSAVLITLSFAPLTPKCYGDSDCIPIATLSYCNGSQVCTSYYPATCINPGTSNATCIISNISNIGRLNCGYCPNGCANRACISSNATCTDTDGGLNFFTRGFLNTSVSSGTRFEDYCLNNILLIERHCLSSDPYNFTIQYACPNGCYGGACMQNISSSEKFCTDSDNGQNLYSKGTLTSDLWNATDKCFENGRVLESWCTGTIPNSQSLECPNGCYEGVCINESSGGGGSGPNPINESPEIEIEMIDPNDFCAGCVLDNNCYPMGYRKSGNFCSDLRNFTEYKEDNSVCDNSFECKSNLCVDDECISGGLFKSMINWFVRLFTSQ